MPQVLTIGDFEDECELDGEIEGMFDTLKDLWSSATDSASAPNAAPTTTPAQRLVNEQAQTAAQRAKAYEQDLADKATRAVYGASAQTAKKVNAQIATTGASINGTIKIVAVAAAIGVGGVLAWKLWLRRHHKEH